MMSNDMVSILSSLCFKQSSCSFYHCEPPGFTNLDVLRISADKSGFSMNKSKFSKIYFFAAEDTWLPLKK